MDASTTIDLRIAFRPLGGEGFRRGAEQIYISIHFLEIQSLTATVGQESAFRRSRARSRDGLLTCMWLRASQEPKEQAPDLRLLRIGSDHSSTPDFITCSCGQKYSSATTRQPPSWHRARPQLHSLTSDSTPTHTPKKSPKSCLTILAQRGSLKGPVEIPGEVKGAGQPKG